MFGLIIVWLSYFIFYFRLILFPHDITVSSNRVYFKQRIEEKSKLNLLYFNKNAEPKLKIIAYEAIFFFAFNLVLTIISFVLYFYLNVVKIVTLICIVYFFIFVAIGVITKVYLFFKK